MTKGGRMKKWGKKKGRLSEKGRRKKKSIEALLLRMSLRKWKGLAAWGRG